MSLRCNDSEFLKERLDKMFVSNKYGQWTSSKIQNEIIEIIADFVTKRIIDEVSSNVGGAAYLGLVCDETSDISRHEQVSIVLRYIDKCGDTKESFLGFIKTDHTDGESLYNVIKDALNKNGIDLSKIVGLGFDGASNMSGPNKGVAVRFKEDSPKSVYVHCYGHLLNLAVKDSLSSEPLLRNTLGIVQSLYTFLEASPKRHAMFVNTEVPVESALIRTLKSLSVTRWSARYESLKGVKEELPRIICCLWSIVQECDSKSSAEAKSLLIAVCDFEFILGLEILMIILPSTSRLSSYIQGISVDIRKVRQNADLVITTLEGCRNEKSFELVWKRTGLVCDEVKELLDENDIDIDFREAKLPKRKPSRRHQALVGEAYVGDTLQSNIQSHHRITSFFPAMDMIVSELKNRFAENEQDILCALESLVFDKEVDKSAFEKVS